MGMVAMESLGLVRRAGRRDVKYENYKGHKLDRKMLELLKRYAG